jgi:hypothetical protein
MALIELGCEDWRWMALVDFGVNILLPGLFEP